MRLRIPWLSGLGEVDIPEYEGDTITLLDTGQEFIVTKAEPYEVLGEGSQIVLTLEPKEET